MEDLYDEDFEDATVSPVPSHVVPGADISAKNSIDLTQFSDYVEGEVQSTAPSILIEPVGPDATQAGDLYDDDFCSPGPSAVLNTGSLTSTDEPLGTPNLTEILPKGLSADHSELLPLERSQENNAEESVYYEDDFALSTDIIADDAGVLPTSKEPVYPQQQNEDIHCSVDNKVTENHAVIIAPDEGAVCAATLEQAQTNALQQETSASNGNTHAGHAFHSTAHHTDHHDSLFEQEDDVNNIELNTDDFDISTSEKATMQEEEPFHAPVSQQAPLATAAAPQEDETASANTVQPEIESDVLIAPAAEQETEPADIDESAQAPAKQALSFTEQDVEFDQPVLFVEQAMNKPLLVAHNEEREKAPEEAHFESMGESVQVATLEEEAAQSPEQMDMVAALENSPAPSLPAAEVVDVTHTVSSLNVFADDAMATGLTDTSTTVYVANEDKATEILPSVSQKTPTVSTRAISPMQKQTSAEEVTVERMEDEGGVVVDEDEVEAEAAALTIDSLPVAVSIDTALSPIASFVATTVLQAQNNLSRPQSAVARDTSVGSFTPTKAFSRPASASPQKMAEELVERAVSQAQINLSRPQSAVARDSSVGSFTPTKAFSRPASASPQKMAEALVERAVSQAQINLSRPQSAVARDAPINPFTPTKMSSRPASASPQKMAEVFVGRTVSQAQTNVVMGSPTRNREGPVEPPIEEPLEIESAAASAPEPAALTEAEDHKTEPAEPASLLERSQSIENTSESLKIGEDAMNEPQGSSSLVLDGIPDAHNKSTKSVAYDEFLSTLGLATPSADSKKAAQLRAMVEESREPTVIATAPPAKKLTKKEQQEADRTFLTSLQYHPPPQQTKKIVYSNSATNVRPVSSRPAAQQPVTKRDLLRGRSAGPNRPTSPARAAPPPKASVPKRKSLSPNRLKPPVDHRTQFVAPPLCLPSQMMPKDLVNYLFASGKESELKISLFCQHGRHFATCKADLCVDAHEKYRWLNLVHQKAKEACELVSDADLLWREKLEKALVKEVAEKKEELEEELAGLSAKLHKKHNASVKLLKQGVRYYESILPALHSGKVTPQELYKATGWTEEHYEHFRRRLQLEEEGAHFKRKQKLDQLAHKHLEILNELQNSLIYPMMYLDGMLKHRLEKIHSAVKRIDLCFQYSIKLAIGIGKGKSEEELKAETEARSPMRNAILAERMQRSTKHGFDILKASLAGIADVCSEVRIMYKGIKRDHDLKQEKRIQEAAHGKDRSPSPTQRQRSPSPNGHKKPKARPKSAPNTASPERRKRPSSRPKSRAARSATTRTETRESGVDEPRAVAKSKPDTLERASKMSYGEDFEPLDSQEVNDNNDEIDEDSVEIHEGTYEEEMDEMMRDMMGEDYASKRVDKEVKGRSRTVSGGDSSIVEDCVSEASSAPRTLTNQSAGTTQGKKSTKARPSTLSVGSAVDDYQSDMEPHLSEKAAVLAKARAQALAKSPGGKNYAPNEEDEIASEVEDDMGFDDNDKDANGQHQKVSVSNMYDDDFVEEDSLMRHAFSSSKKSKNASKKSSRKKKTTSQKVAQLMHNDPLVKPLASMKPTQMNEQSILHGILLAHNIPINYSDEPEIIASQKQKPLVITNTLNQPVVLNLASPKKVRAKSADLQRPSSPVDAFLAEMRRSSMNPRTSMINSAWNLPKLARGELRCFHCQTQFPAGRVKFLPSTAVSSDPEIFEVAKAKQKESNNLFPTFEKIQVTSNTEAQRRWILEQQEKRQEQLAPAALKQTSDPEKKSSITHQRSERPFCSWECVKAWCHINFPPQQRYQNDLLIDVNAGYKVVAKAD